MDKICDYNRVFDRFYEYLETRLNIQGIHTTEDSVRYTFFYAVTEVLRFIKPEHFILEYPLGGVGNRKLDSLIICGESSAAFEFKYFGELPGDHNRDRTSTAGSVFCDIFRLNEFEYTKRNIRRFFVMVLDAEMYNYFGRDRNGLDDFYNLNVNGRELRINTKYLQPRSKTLKKAAGCASESGIGDAVVICRFSDHLPNDHAIRIYEVLNG